MWVNIPVPWMIWEWLNLRPLPQWPRLGNIFQQERLPGWCWGNPMKTMAKNLRISGVVTVNWRISTDLKKPLKIWKWMDLDSEIQWIDTENGAWKKVHYVLSNIVQFPRNRWLGLEDLEEHCIPQKKGCFGYLCHPPDYTYIYIYRVLIISISIYIYTCILQYVSTRLL